MHVWIKKKNFGLNSLMERKENMKKTIFVILALTVIFSLVAVGCGGGTTTTTTQATSQITTTSTTASVVAPTDARLPNLGDLAKPEGGKSGGRLQLVSAGNILNIGNIKNAVAGPGDAAYAWPCVEPLMILDGNGQFQPWLAERFVIADDFSSFTFYLRHGVKFTDGTPFNADAVKYVVDTAIANPIYASYHCFTSPEVIDEYTVKVGFVNGKWNWDGAKGLATWWGLLMFSPKYLQGGDDEALKLGAVGTGPFILTQYVRDQKLVYDKNPNYWRGEPYLDGIDYQIIPDATAELLAFEAGEIHFLGVQLKDIQRLKDEGFGIVESFDACFAFCLLPASAKPDDPTSDIRVRQAIQYAIDQDAIIKGITYGFGKPCQQEFAVEPYKDPTVVGYPYNPDKAKELLAAAGYGTGLTLNIWMNDAVPMDVPLALQDMLGKVGITINFQKVSIIQFGAMIQAGSSGWDGLIYTYAFPGKAIDPGFTASLYMGAGTWPSTLKPADITELMNKGSVEPDQTKRIAIYQQISKLMTDTYCLRQYVYLQGGYSSVSPKLAGYTMGQYKEWLAWTFAYFK
jgi:ABC-type transport system substrate-binding protein